MNNYALKVPFLSLGTFKSSIWPTLLSNPCPAIMTVPGAPGMFKEHIPLNAQYAFKLFFSKFLLCRIQSQAGMDCSTGGLCHQAMLNGLHGPMHPPIALKPFHIGIEREPSLTQLACSTRE